jgi:hypothetical protein
MHAERMDTMSESRSRTVASVSLGLALLLLAAGANAQPAQRHPLKLSGTALQQDVSLKTGLGVVSRGKFTEKFIGAFCLGLLSPVSDHAVVLMFEDPCGDPNQNEMQVVNKKPFLVLETIGSVTFDWGFELQNYKKDVLSSSVVPMTIHFDCTSDIIDMDVEVDVIGTIGMDSSGECVETIKAQNGSGTGIINEDPTIFDRTKFDAKKPDASLALLP